VDRFRQGVVLRAADGAYLELAKAKDKPAPLAFQLKTDTEVDDAYAACDPRSWCAVRAAIPVATTASRCAARPGRP